MTTVHWVLLLIGVHPVQVPTRKLAAGFAVRVTGVPLPYVAVQVPGQLMPGPVTVPFTGGVTTREKGCWVNVAVTLLGAVMVRAQGLPWPPQSPPHPPNENPAAGFAVRVTGVPPVKLTEHVPEQLLIPTGLLVTVPLPTTVTVRFAVSGRGTPPK